MPPESSSWDRRELLRERRYDRGEKISVPRGRRDFHDEAPPPGFGPPQPSAASPSYNRGNNHALWPSGSTRQGRYRLYSEDGAQGYTSSPSPNGLAQEKIYRDENLGFRMEGRYGKRNKYILGSRLGSDNPSSNDPAQDKTCEEEDSGFQMEGRHYRRGRELAGVSLSSPSSNALAQEKTYEVANLGFLMEGTPNKRNREFMGPGLSSKSPSSYVPFEERVHENESVGFHMEGIHNRRGRELLGSNTKFSYVQRDRSKLQLWDSGVSTLFHAGKHDIVSGKSVDRFSLHSPRLYYDSENSWDQIQSQEQCTKTRVDYSNMERKSGVNQGASENDLERLPTDFEAILDRYWSLSSSDSLVGDAQNSRQDHLDGFIDQKPLKWGRSGKSSSWSSIFGQAGCSKEPKREMQNSHDMNEKTSPHYSTSRLSGEGFCIVPDDETHNRKKQRLGWGQGLAKYEKQKVEGSEDENKSDLIQCDVSLSPKIEGVQRPLETNSPVRSPKVTGSSACMSPATTNSITCMSSPDEHVSSSGAGTNDAVIEEKASLTIFDINSNRGHVADGSPLLQCTIPSTGFDSILVESSLASEHCELKRAMPMNSVQTEGVTLKNSGFEESLTADKLHSLKNDMLQRLERTEYDIEKYEAELKMLNSEIQTEDCFFLTANPAVVYVDCLLEACTETGDKDLGDRCSNALDGDVQLSSTMATSRDGFIGHSLDPKADEVSPSHVPLPMQANEHQVLIPKENATDMKVTGFESSKETSLYAQSIESELLKQEGSLDDTRVVRAQSPVALEINDYKCVSGNNSCTPVENQLISVEVPVPASCIENIVGMSAHLSGTVESRDSASSIFAVNKELAKEASEFINKLLLPVPYETDGTLISDILDSSIWKVLHERNRKQIEAKIVEKGHLSSFKERALALKFRIRRQSWKDDQLSLPTKRHRARAQRPYEISCRLSGGNQKHRSSTRCRLNSPGSSALDLKKEAIELSGKFISDGQNRPYRCFLRMPSLILDEKERHFSRFITWNGSVGDPIAVEKERVMVNPWAAEERGIFMEKFSMFGKNFSRIASFLEHKTTADCIEFYYKNQKSEDFHRLKKTHKMQKEKECHPVNNYLATSGSSRHRDYNAVSSDVVKAASVVAMCCSGQVAQFQDAPGKYAGKQSMGVCFDQGTYRSEVSSEVSDKGIVNAHDLESERECTAAADVLAGICGAMSSEAVSSLTGGADQCEGLYEKSFSRSYLKENADIDYPLTFEASQNNDTQYSSEESCEEINIDWTDDEKALFINAVSMFGRDFGSISCYVGSRTEDQCKAFFSKARKRLGLDEFMPQELLVPAKGNHGSDDDEQGPDRKCPGICDLGSSPKRAKIPVPNDCNAVQPNNKANTVLDELCDGSHMIETQNSQVESSMEDARASENEETEVNKRTDAVQNNMETLQKETASFPEGEQFFKGRLLMTTSGALQKGTFMDLQQNDNNAKVQNADVLCSKADIKSQNIIDPCDRYCKSSGDGVEVKADETGDTVIPCSLEKLPTGNLERCDGVNEKVEFKNHEEVGSPMELASAENDVTMKLPASVACPNSLYNEEVLNSNSLHKTPIDESTTLHLSGDISSKEKISTGSVPTAGDNDPVSNFEVMSSTKINLGIEGNNEILAPNSILSASTCSSSTANRIPHRMYLDINASYATSTSTQPSVSGFQQKPSNQFSQFPQQAVHDMQPEVVAWQEKQQVPSAVVSKSDAMFQNSAPPALVRNQKLKNEMICRDQNMQEFSVSSRKAQPFQQPDNSGSEISPGQFKDQLEALNQVEDSCQRNVPAYQYLLQYFKNSEKSSRQLGGCPPNVLHQSEAHANRNLDVHPQEDLHQCACDSEVSAKLLGGHPLMLINQEDIYCQKSIDTCQRASHQQLAQGCSDSELKNLQHQQAIQQGSEGTMIQNLHRNTDKEQLALAAQFLQKPVSKQLVELWNYKKQTQIPEQYQLLHHWQQKHKGHHVICNNHIVPQKIERQVDHHEHVQYWPSKNSMSPLMKPSHSPQISSSSPMIDVKSCAESDEQPMKRGDVKLFGQILQSHSSDPSKLPAKDKDVTGCAVSLQGSHGKFPMQANDEHCRALAKHSIEQHSATKYSCMHSEGHACIDKNITGCRVRDSSKHMPQCFAWNGSSSKHDLSKAGNCLSVQEFGRQNFGFREAGSEPSNYTMSVQTGSPQISRDLDLQCKSMAESSPGSICVDQAINSGKHKGISLDASMIQGWQCNIRQALPYLIKDPVTIHSGYRPSEYKELGGGSFYNLNLTQPHILMEVNKSGGAFDIMPVREPGRCDMVQSMYSLQGQTRNTSGHMGFQAGGAVSGSFVSDPVAAFRMQCSAAEQVAASNQHAHFTSTRDQELGRGDYGR